jgi:hypothetical protein
LIGSMKQSFDVRGGKVQLSPVLSLEQHTKHLITR